jgi:hypothetical protein
VRSVVGFVLVASLALALFKAMLAVLLWCYALLFIVAVLIKPRETFGLMLLALACFLLSEHTVATLVSLVALCAIGALAKAISGGR